MQCCRMCCLHICSSWGVYDEGKKGWKRVGFLEEGVVNIDGGAGKHEEDALVVEEDDELGIQPFLVLQTHDFVLQHLGVSEKKGERTLNTTSLCSRCLMKMYSSNTSRNSTSFVLWRKKLAR